MPDLYRWVGPYYDLLANWYSGGRIHMSKVSMIRELAYPGRKCLFVGAGHGADALLAAECGADVTVIDISQTMINQLKSRFEKLSRTKPGVRLNLTIVHGDLLKAQFESDFDAVFLNYFLNVHSEGLTKSLLKKAAGYCRSGGRVVVGDFHYPRKKGISKWIYLTYWASAMCSFWIIAGNALHKIYDNEALLRNEGLTIEQTRVYRFLGMDCCACICAVK